MCHDRNVCKKKARQILCLGNILLSFRLLTRYMHWFKNQSTSSVNWNAPEICTPLYVSWQDHVLKRPRKIYAYEYLAKSASWHVMRIGQKFKVCQVFVGMHSKYGRPLDVILKVNLFLFIYLVIFHLCIFLIN
jgi:hypothetical protein